MKSLALVVFAIHAVLEVVFGLNALISGGFSSLSAEQLANMPPEVRVSARFLGAALLSLGLMGAWVIFWPGVSSPVGRQMALLLAGFHLIGLAGAAFTALFAPALWISFHTWGAMVIHGLLGLGFLTISRGVKLKR